MVYIVEFWETKERKEACSCVVQASKPASLRRGSWLPLRCSPSGIKALKLSCPLLPSDLPTLLPPDTPRLHTSAQGRGNLLGSWSLSFQYCLTDCSALPIAPGFFQNHCNPFLLLNHLSQEYPEWLSPHLDTELSNSSVQAWQCIPVTIIVNRLELCSHGAYRILVNTLLCTNHCLNVNSL